MEMNLNLGAIRGKKFFFKTIFEEVSSMHPMAIQGKESNFNATNFFVNLAFISCFSKASKTYVPFAL